jgi:hypothetical protein
VLPRLRQNLFAVELRLRYREKLAQPQRAMFRSGCDTSGCEYTRVLEYPCVRAEPVPLDCLPDDSKQWREDFDQTWKKVREEIERVASVDLDEVLKYLRKHPPHKFCFLDDLVCCFRGSGTRDSYEAKKNADRWRPLVQFWLFVDWYLHYLECACWSCLPDRGGAGWACADAARQIRRFRHLPSRPDRDLTAMAAVRCTRIGAGRSHRARAIWPRICGSPCRTSLSSCARSASDSTSAGMHWSSTRKRLR